MVVAVQAISGPLEEEKRRRAIYGGDLLIFKNVEPMVEFCSLVDGLIREALGAEDPMRAQFRMDREDYLARVEALQKRFRAEERPKGLLLRGLEGVGVDPRRTFWDKPYLRVSPHGGEHEDRRTQKLGFHRDTWASNVYSQTNWWAPIYPITAGRAVAFYPEYWEKPLKNTSAGWDLEEVRAGKITSIVPEPAEPVSTASELRVVVEPGDLLCFSGAHLHASVPNETGLARFSVEVRTADAEDEAAGRGAPNLDGEAPRVALGWFRRMEGDLLPLPEALSRSREGESHG
jgi:hypothetical protein